MTPADVAPTRRMSREEYLAFDRADPERRWTLWDGELFAMAGASIDHEWIVSNIVASAHAGLGDGPCGVLPSNVRTRIPGRDRYVFADALIVCGDAQLEDEHADTLLNPTVLFEVLSDSTEKFDRGEKFAALRTIPSLRTVVFVSQQVRRVEVYGRAPGANTWELRSYEGSATVLLDAVDIAVSLDAIYARTALA